MEILAEPKTLILLLLIIPPIAGSFLYIMLLSTFKKRDKAAKEVSDAEAIAYNSDLFIAELNRVQENDIKQTNNNIDINTSMYRFYIASRLKNTNRRLVPEQLGPLFLQF